MMYFMFKKVKMNLDRVEKVIEDAFVIATTHDLTSVSDQVKNHYRHNLGQIAIAMLDAIRNENNSTLYEIQNKLK